MQKTKERAAESDRKIIASFLLIKKNRQQLLSGWLRVYLCGEFSEPEKRSSSRACLGRVAKGLVISVERYGDSSVGSFEHGVSDFCYNIFNTDLNNAVNNVWNDALFLLTIT